MEQSAAQESTSVLENALASLASGAPGVLTGPDTRNWSERCVEVPWIASHLGSAKRILDVGWAMSPPEWLGVLLSCQQNGAYLIGIDIIDPQRVRTRYPEEIVERVLNVPVRIESILDAQPTEGKFDVITCVSTLEHIGFDIATEPSDTSTAFVRGKTPEEAVNTRSITTDKLFLDAVARLLTPGGALLLSVPVGHGVPILHRDSLGLYTHQFEYDEQGWKDITSDTRFTLSDEAFFRHDETAGWHQVNAVGELTDQTSRLRPFATGCAVAKMTLK
jgi:SAM-dependent methyltransferase